MKLGLKEMDCNYFQTKSRLFGENIDLDSLADARPDGYKVKLKFSVVGAKDAWIRISTATSSEKFYQFGTYFFL